MLYLIVNESKTKCKIGFSKDPEKRLKALQTGNPEKLEVLATYPAGRIEEIKYHRMFAYLKLNGEWFSFSPQIAELVYRWNSRIEGL